MIFLSTRYRYRIGIFALVLSVYFTADGFAQEPEIKIPLVIGGAADVNNFGVQEDTFALVIDSDATDLNELDNFDESAPPPPAFLGYAVFDSEASPTGLVVDARPDNDSITYKLEIVYGLEPTPVPDDPETFFDIKMSWNVSDFNSAKAAGYAGAELRSSDGSTLLMDMLRDGTGADLVGTVDFIFEGSDRGEESFLIVIKKGNATPVARADEAFTIENTTIVVDVLANDFDAEGDSLTITSVNSSTGANVSISNGKINYTPPAGFISQLDNEGNRIPDTFTYTITQPSVDEFDDHDTTTVSVVVFEGVVQGLRSHAARSKSGAEIGDGLTVDVTLIFDSSIETLELVETFPEFDGSTGLYRIADGFGPGNLDISGDITNLQSVDGNGESTDVRFIFSPVPNSPIRLTYRLIEDLFLRDVSDVLEKQIRGTVNYRTTGDSTLREVLVLNQNDLSSAVTTFTPVAILSHSSDFRNLVREPQPDGRIDALELGRLIILFNNGGFYKIDRSTIDGFNVSDSEPLESSGYHSADFRNLLGESGSDWRIDITELARALELFNDGHCYTVDNTTPDGFNISDCTE